MISLIAAIGRNNELGKGNTLLWPMPADMKHFKELTTGNVVIMGRKTWESIPEKYRPLPNRTNIVITRQNEYELPSGVEKYSSPTDAIAAHTNDNLFIIGGTELYRATLDNADTLEITHVHREIEGDAFFPSIDPATWKEQKREDHPEFSFVTYTRI